jgi:pyruvate,water dikinase
LESYLNTTKDTLLENVKNCWASLFTPRAIFYRFEKKLHLEAVSVAVVVQKMVESEVSGICFTVHPVTEDKDQMVIEAGWGLGEAIVGGIITPDTFVIDKSVVQSPKSKVQSPITDKYISEQAIMIVRSPEGTQEKSVPEEKREKQKISDEKLVELAKICLGIEKHYGFPCDIEWAAAAEGSRNQKSNLKDQNLRLYIVQSRPITTLS